MNERDAIINKTTVEKLGQIVWLIWTRCVYSSWILLNISPRYKTINITLMINNYNWINIRQVIKWYPGQWQIQIGWILYYNDHSNLYQVNALPETSRLILLASLKIFAIKSVNIPKSMYLVPFSCLITDCPTFASDTQSSGYKVWDRTNESQPHFVIL